MFALNKVFKRNTTKLVAIFYVLLNETFWTKAKGSTSYHRKIFNEKFREIDLFEISRDFDLACTAIFFEIFCSNAI